MEYNLKKNMLYLILSAVLLVTASGCKEKITYRDKEVEGYWNHYLFSDPIYNFVTNGLVVDDIYIISNQGGVLIFNDLMGYPQRYGGSNLVDYNSKTALSKELSAHRRITNNYDHIHFYRHANIGTGYNYLDIERFGEKFKNFRFKQNYQSIVEIGAFNTKNRFVTIIADFKVNNSGTELNEHIVFVDFDFNGQSSIAISDFGYFEIPSIQLSPNRSRAFSNVISYNDNFYVAYYDANAGIVDYSYIELSEKHGLREFYRHLPERIIAFFVYRDYLFAQLYLGHFVYTADGENWNWAGNLNYGIQGPCDIDGYLFFYHDDKIYFLEPVNGDLQNMVLYKIENDNIKGRTISSINKFKDDLVITTSNGIFYQKITQVIKDAEKIKK